ncbi:hypothetical protein [Pseudomonas japonica]|uniref:Uncharacterized protein n=1 Tax=Pseudomonas japonica TaxID=256466 RepID=A0A239LTK9_9PSED|nr:hypothetical protein [Pseudomonas japonica]SNT32964.1 hypothetical protein SAMN05444352_14126 [Pseudomonas japonica]
MWWLLIPVIGTVVAAVVNSDSEKEKEEAERQARAKSREQAEAHARKRDRDNAQTQRNQRLTKDIDAQLSELMTSHKADLILSGKSHAGVSIESLRAFVASPPLATAQGQLKALRLLAPNTRFSPQWLERERQAKALRAEIQGLKRLKRQLLDRSL